jgi:anti-anti-sigma factor
MTEDAFSVSPHGEVDVLQIQGDLDIASVGAFSEIARSVSAAGRPVIVDFTDCAFIDSTGLHALAAAHALLPERSTLVVPDKGAVRRLFQITGFESAFPSKPSLEAALGELGAGPP